MKINIIKNLIVLSIILLSNFSFGQISENQWSSYNSESLDNMSLDEDQLISRDAILSLIEAQNANKNVYDKTEEMKRTQNIKKTSDKELKDEKSPINYDNMFDSLYILSIYKRFYDREELLKKVKVFGEQFFIFPPEMFNQIPDMPIPMDYRFGPGDVIEISFWGDVQTRYKAEIRNDGNVLLPHIGKVFVSGLTYEALKRKLLALYSKVFSSLAYGKKGARTFMDINLDKMRTIKVYALGEAQNPGVYILNGLANALTGVYFTGGPSKNGSFRNIKIIRDNEIIGNIDLYDFILNGKVQNIRLQDGDIILYPPRGKKVRIDGEVFRPLTYELKENETLKDLLKFCGGVKTTAYIKSITIARVLPIDNRKDTVTTEKITLTFNSKDSLLNSSFILEDLDVISIKKINNYNRNKVYIGGSGINQPGYYGIDHQIRTLKDLIDKAGYLKKDFYRKITLFRKLPNNQYTVKTFSLEEAYNLLLQPYDSIITYNQKELFHADKIRVRGAVNKETSISYHPGIKIADALLIANGFKPNADTNYIEIMRVDTLDEDVFSHSIICKFTKNLQPLTENIELKPGDYIYVHANPNILRMRKVKVRGYVKYPGDYALHDNKEKLSDIIKRCGGPRSDGNLKAATLVRNNIKMNVNIYNAYKNPKSADNIYLINGDSIYVPVLDQSVYVYGEIYFPSKIVWVPNQGPGYYIEQAGGITDNGDKKRIVAFLGSGRRAKIRKFWFDDRLDPGSVVYVPKKTPKPSTFVEGLKITRETLGILTSVASLVVSYYTIKALQEK